MATTQAMAKAKFVRGSIKKARLVASLIRGKSANEALAILFGLRNKKKMAEAFEKTLKSAIANYSNQVPNGDIDALEIKEVRVDGGPVMKRIRPRAQGRAMRILKRTSHISMVLGE
ncbi:MAG: 50S ribosomal protein L22 [Fibrobacterota bacterium]